MHLLGVVHSLRAPRIDHPKPAYFKHSASHLMHAAETASVWEACPGGLMVLLCTVAVAYVTACLLAAKASSVCPLAQDY